MSMTYCIKAKGMTAEEFKEFIITNMIPLKKLLENARKNRMPKMCNRCGTTLEEMVRRYKKIPTGDLTFYLDENRPILYQTASGGGDCRKMKDGLRRIVRNHFAKKLRKAGKSYRKWSL